MRDYFGINRNVYFLYPFDRKIIRLSGRETPADVMTLHFDNANLQVICALRERGYQGALLGDVAYE